MEHLRLNLKLLKKHKLYARLINYDFYEDRTHYLCHNILDKGIFVDPKNIEAMMSWPAPRKLTDVRSFVALAEYCMKFTEEDWSGKVESMYRLRKSAWELVVP